MLRSRNFSTTLEEFFYGPKIIHNVITIAKCRLTVFDNMIFDIS